MLPLMPGPRDYKDGTKAALTTLSRGHCYYPNCHEPTIVFVDGEPIINYQIAHIKDASPGNRYQANMTDDERRAFANLVLLCKPHHTYVDKTNPDDFPSATLQGWKDERESSGVAELRGLDGLTAERLGELIREALAPGARPASADLDWNLDEDDFEIRVANLLRDDDDITLRRFLRSAVEAWRTQIDLPDGSDTELIKILDRLICLAAYAVRWGRPEWASHALSAYEEMYDAVLTDHGAVRANLAKPGHELLAGIMNRVLGLATVVVTESAWELLPEAVLRRPAHLHDVYTNWVQHAMNWFSQAGGLERADPESGKPVKTAYLEHTIDEVGSIRCLNVDAPDVERFRTRIAGVDALAALAVWHHAPGDGDRPYMPWHRAYDADRYEGAIVVVLTDQHVRDIVFPGSDEALAELLLQLEDFGIQHMGRYGGGDRYVNPTIQRFVASERERRDHKCLVDSVIAHAKAIGAALPLSRRGRNPTMVTYTDGSIREFAADLETYKRLMEAGEVNHRTASPGAPPTVIDLWSDEALQAWLDDH